MSDKPSTMNIKKRWAKTTLSNKLMVYTTVLVAFGTLFYAAVAFFQWELMKASGEQASNQATAIITEVRRIADSSTENAKLAKAAIDSSIESFRLDQRAWVGVTEISPAPYSQGDTAVFVKEGQKIKAELVIKNTGRTPAFKLQTLVTLHYQKSGEPIVINKQPLQDLLNSSRILHPGSTGYMQTSELKGFPNSSDIDNLVNRRYSVYVTALIVYDDVFGRPHSTEFCAVLMPDLSRFGLCKTNNSAH